MSNQRLLEIRLEELRQDVMKVQSAVEMAARRNQLVDTLRARIGMWGEHSAVQPLNRAKNALASLPDVLNQAWPGLLELVRSNGIDLEKVNQDMETVKIRLQEAQDALTKADIPDVLDDALTGAINTNLQSCEAITYAIEDLQLKLAAGDDVQSLWAKYDEILTHKCEPLFADYVDFLGGLTLRDNQLDERIGDLTEAFVRELGERRLAIPTRGPAGPSVLSVLIKLGFPEWTLWDVPMAAYEVALQRTVSSELVKGLLARELSGRNAAQEAVLFADVSAAFDAGPAYACAAVLLHLRPDREASDEFPADVDRAYVIFELLQRRQQYGQFAADVALVREWWSNAAAELVNAVHLADTERLDRFVSAVYDRRSKQRVLGDGFGPARWEAAVATLEQRLTTPDKPTKHRGPVMDLVNAAWSAWVRGMAPPRDIEIRALGAWERPSQQPTGGPVGRQEGHVPSRSPRP